MVPAGGWGAPCAAALRGGAPPPWCPGGRVLWEWAGARGGRLLAVDAVLAPPPGAAGGGAAAPFPRASLYTLLTSAPQLGTFTRMLEVAGLLGALAVGGDPPSTPPAPGAAAPATGAPWAGAASTTLFAPTDAAFAGALPPAAVAHLLSPAGRELARHVALTHALRGEVYTYACALRSAAAGGPGGNVTQASASGATLVVGWAPAPAPLPAEGVVSAAAAGGGGGGGWVLTLGVAGTGAGFTAASLPPGGECGGTDWEAVNGLLSPVGGLLLDGWAAARLAAVAARAG